MKNKIISIRFNLHYLLWRAVMRAIPLFHRVIP